MKADLIYSLNNYKLIEDKEFTIPEDASIIVVTGKNEIGKSSFLTGLEELIMSQKLADETVTRGKTKGWKKLDGLKGADGKTYSIVHTFSSKDPKGKFVLYDDQENTIKKVTEIREILGIYNRMTVDDFYNKALTLPGRRKIIDDFLNPLLPENKQLEILEAKNAIKKDKDTRKNVNDEITRLEANIEASKLDTDKQKMVDNIDNAKKKLEEYKDTLEKVQKAETSINEIEDVLTVARNLFDKISHYQFPGKDNFSQDFLQTLSDYMSPLEQAKEGFEETCNEIWKLDNGSEVTVKTYLQEKINAGNTYITKAETYLENSKKVDQYKENLQDAQRRHKALEDKIESSKEAIKKIYKDSSLPAGIEIIPVEQSDEFGFDFTLNGFSFDREDTSKSKAALAIAEVLCQIDTAQIKVLGEAAIFDNSRLKDLEKIAEKYGKKIFLERVISNQSEVDIVCSLNEDNPEQNDNLF